MINILVVEDDKHTRKLLETILKREEMCIRDRVSSYIYEYNKNYLFLGLLMVSIFITAIYVVLFNKSGIWKYELKEKSIWNNIRV